MNAHLSKEEARRRGMPEDVWRGHKRADELAGEGAREHREGEGEDAELRKRRALTKYIHRHFGQRGNDDCKAA